MNKKILLFAIVTLAIDQISKVLVSLFLQLNISIQVIPNFFYLTLCHNEGAAWGIFSNHSFVILFGPIVAIFLIYHFIYCFKSNLRNNVAFGLLCGGLAGNLIDRIVSGYVIDFLDFYLFRYDYPVFNVADIAIVIGIFLLTYAVIKGEDVNETNRGKGKRKARQVSSK